MADIQLAKLTDVTPKADKTYVDTQLGTKANTSDLTAKADTTYVNTQLGTKADTSTVAGKADQTYVDTQLATKANASQSGWTAPTFAGTWSNFGAGTSAAGFMKDTLGFVHLKGTVKNDTSFSGTIFQLPSNYRPSETLYVGTTSNSAHGELIINTDGTINLSFGTSWISLNNITFKAEQ